MTTSATTAQIQALANAVALQADAIATGRMAADQTVASAVALLKNNVETLAAWTKEV